MEFRNVVEKTESEALERMTREPDVEMEEPRSGCFLSSPGRTLST